MALEAYNTCLPLAPYLFSDESKLTFYLLKERHVRMSLLTSDTSGENIRLYRVLDKHKTYVVLLTMQINPFFDLNFNSKSFGEA